ncbi:BatD family protein [Desulfoluna spongiiphila]|uniref:Oxygen tolerance n=1 Tax=Desulfoluna spongiiphila TaxID=419481 RepID=A0A1G5IK05_9BACT|nr:BatD family protein [Desulfoluna spongiiphila]SCY76111.1 Oxygen tolerance [Desulfoluna spongiiphila]
MKRMFPLLLTILLCGLGASAVHAEGARAVVDTNRLRLGESLTLRVVADFDDARVHMPELADFRVSPRGTSSRMQMINGRTTREVESLYLLVPLRTGSLTIPAIPVKGRGVVVHTQPVTVRVAERGVASSTDQPWRVTAEVSNTTPYVGEQLVWTFRFQTAARFQNARLGKPDFEGFSSDEMGEGRAFEQVINGRRYAIHEVTELLIPQKSGAVDIKPASLSVSLVTGRSRRSQDPFFDDFFSSRSVMEQKLLTTDGVSLTVSPLPPYSGDASFSGLVGDFSFTASLEKEQVQAGDPLTLTLTISGTGNIRDAAAPLLFLPGGMKQYGDTPVEEIGMGPGGWQGQKTFKTAIVPLTAGTVTIPPVTLVWFDPKSGSYRTQRSGPLVFTVTENKAAEEVEVFQAGGSAPSMTGVKDEVRLKGRDILPLKVDPDAVTHRAPMSMTVFLAWLAGPLGLCLLVAFGLKRFTRDLSVAQALSRKAARAVKDAEKAVGDNDLFYEKLHVALAAVMGALAGRPVEGMTGEDIRGIVTGAGGRAEAAEACVAILSCVEAARYGGGSEGQGGRKEKLRVLGQLVKEVKA